MSAQKGRSYPRTIQVHARFSDYVDVDLDEVLEELTNDDLLKILESRSAALPQPPDDLVAEAYEELRAGRIADAIITLERMLFPKWPDAAKCRDDFQKLHEGTE